MEYFTDKLSVYEMDKRIFIVWFWKRVTKLFDKIISFEECVLGFVFRSTRLIGIRAAINGIESLTLLCESEEDVSRTLERYHLELDILRAEYYRLKGDF